MSGVQRPAIVPGWTTPAGLRAMHLKKVFI